MWSILDTDSGCVTLRVTSFFILYKYFVIFVCWFLLAISQVYTPTLNKVITINKYSIKLRQMTGKESEISISAGPTFRSYSSCSRHLQQENPLRMVIVQVRHLHSYNSYSSQLRQLTRRRIEKCNSAGPTPAQLYKRQRSTPTDDRKEK